MVLNHDKLSKYALNDQMVAAKLLTKGFATSGGRVKDDSYTHPIYVAESLNTVYDIQQLIVYTDPLGNNIRLKDIADVKRNMLLLTAILPITERSVFAQRGDEERAEHCQDG